MGKDPRADHILARLDEMRQVKSEFDRRWKTNDNRLWAFMLNDGSTHLPNAWRMIETLTDEVTRDFNGDVTFFPRMESGVREGFQFDYISRIYNQLNQSIGIQQERKMAIKDSFRRGQGWIFEGYTKTGENNSFDYLISERVDPREMFKDNRAQKYYDPQGLTGSGDIIRRRWYSTKKFEKKFLETKDPRYNKDAIREILNSGMSDYEKKKFSELSYHGETKMSDAGISIIEQNELQTGLICLYEYWNEENDILRQMSRGLIAFDDENPYEGLPFIQYTPFLEYETVNPPSFIEVVSPILKLKEILVNLWYMNARITSTPVIFADKSTQLVPGAPLRPGVQTVELNGRKINELVQQVRLGTGVSESLISFMSFLDDELTKASSLDQRALNSKPNELATQTLQKVENELKSLRGIIETMIISSESHRATMRAKNMLKYILKDNKDVVLNNFTILPDGKLRSAEGSQATITLSEEDWQGFEFDVIVKSKKQNAIMQEEQQAQLLRMLEVANTFYQNPNIAPETKQRLRIDVLYEEIFKTFPGVDASKIFVQDKGVSRVQEDMSMLERGEMPEVGEIDQKGKDNAMKSALKGFGKDKDGIQIQKTIDYLTSLNNAKPQKKMEEPSPVAAGGGIR